MATPDEKDNSRRIRVFVSSTFRDMKLEREELVKFIFPQLRKICEQRDVEWGEVDLRWGISEEQKAEYGILPVCLEEIERCRPYFIGILGERYGWVPDSIPKSLIETQEWLAEHLSDSITALEIIHGVLRQPKMAGHSFFYFRDPSYITTLPPDEQNDFLELPTEEEIVLFTPEEARGRAEKRRQKLKKLKETILEKGLPVRPYSTPKELGQLVLRDFSRIIDTLYLEGSYPDPYDREQAEQSAYLASNFWTKKGVYIPRAAYLEKLDAHARGTSPPLVITGDEGSGKSALLAHWIDHVKVYGDLTQPKIISHFIGSTASSTQWMHTCKRLMHEIAKTLDLPLDYLDTAQGVRKAFVDLLARVPERNRIIVVIDGLDHHEDHSGALDLTWLPPQVPPGIRLILSTNAGRPLEEAIVRQWPVLFLNGFNIPEQQNFIEKYFWIYGKTLSQGTIDRISRSPFTSNPQFLFELLNELRVYGDFGTLDKKIESLLDIRTMEGLYYQILDRLEEDYSKDRHDLVRDALTIIVSSRYGLFESELLDLLGTESNRLPGAYWSPLSLALHTLLLSKSGLLDLSNNSFRRAVIQKYFDSGIVGRESIHGHLATYFESRDFNKRRLDELPWQLVNAGNWKALAELLNNPTTVELLWFFKREDLFYYWNLLDEKGSISFSDLYKTVRETPEEFSPDFVQLIAQGFAARRYVTIAISLQEYIVAYYRTRKDIIKLIPSLGNLAVFYFNSGNLEKAAVLHKEEELLSREFDHPDQLQNSLGNQGNILFVHKDYEGALFLYREQEKICRDIGNLDGLYRSLENQVTLLISMGDTETACRIEEEGLHLAKIIGDKENLKSSLFNQALLFYQKGDTSSAAHCLERIGDIERRS